jgi:hypothetical protein
MWPSPITGMRTFRQALASTHPGIEEHSRSGAAFALRRTDVESLMKQTLAIVALTALVAAGCAARGVRVAELKDQPAKYATRSVSVT